MSDDLANEIEAINSIYAPSTIGSSSDPGTYILAIPNNPISVRLQFPLGYPNAPPTVLGTDASGEHTKKGYASYVLGVVKCILGNIYRPGEVCLFDLLEELRGQLRDRADKAEDGNSASEDASIEIEDNTTSNIVAPDSSLAKPVLEDPPWTLSSVITEKKSVFVARSAPVASPTQARAYLDHLVATDKKIAKATHNITAWRIQSIGSPEVTFQDFDDDGETAAGGRLLHLMQVMGVWGVMVVVSRWYGGVLLGPDRFRIINTVARDALVKGGHTVAETRDSGTKDAVKKKGKP
ncbi:MAG: eIF2 kinase Gcn2p negative regulator [Candelina mexicana]|nr:MAG: eIF2 kinase Gcn2p negative regulator [Candelina mexicana]